MKKLLFILVIGSVFASALFFGCSFFEPPNVDKNAPSQSPGSIDSERKDALALKHLQIPVAGKSEIKFVIFGIPIYGTGHMWVVDGYRRMTTKAKYDKNEPAVDYPADYVHCNLGWEGNKNGWYFDGVFDASDDGKKIPLPDARSSTPNNYQWDIRMLTGITPQ